jgi:hypothetical protein
MAVTASHFQISKVDDVKAVLRKLHSEGRSTKTFIVSSMDLPAGKNILVPLPAGSLNGLLKRPVRRPSGCRSFRALPRTHPVQGIEHRHDLRAELVSFRIDVLQPIHQCGIFGTEGLF